jgi:hypothetical protein
VLAPLLVLAQLAGGTESVIPGTRDAPTFTPARVAKPPAIDGDLSDPQWAAAPETTAFTQKFPREGAAPSERTTLKVLYDDDALYVAFDLVQTGVPIVARMARRDRDIESDFVSIDVDSRALFKTAFEFTVTAAGVLKDGIRANEVIENARPQRRLERRDPYSAAHPSLLVGRRADLGFSGAKVHLRASRDGRVVAGAA